METDRTDLDSTALGLARQTLYQFFAGATGDPLTTRWDPLFSREFRLAAAAAADFALGQAACSAPRDFTLAPGELAPPWLALEGDGRPLDLLAERDREAILEEHERVFGLTVSKECPAHETEYCPQTFDVYRSQRMADIGGFYRAFGLRPSTTAPERPDHVSMELEFMGWLLAKESYAGRSEDDEEGEERAAICREAAARFAGEHLFWWLPAFARALWRKAEGLDDAAFDDAEVRPATFLGALARSLAAFSAVERAFMRLPAPSELAAPNPVEIEGPEETACADCALAKMPQGPNAERSTGGNS